MSDNLRAKYEGTCPKCGKEISRGDEIVRGDDGHMVHADCDSAIELEEMCRAMPQYCGGCKHYSIGCRKHMADFEARCKNRGCKECKVTPCPDRAFEYQTGTPIKIISECLSL
jgi:hypothetical protein